MLTFIFFDVQHGSACYIRTPKNKHIAIDLGIGSYGSSNSVFSPLRYLRNSKWGVGQLDGVVITHPHRDHLDDIFNLEALSPKILYRPEHLSEDDIRSGNRPVDKDVTDKYLAICRGYGPLIDYSINPFDKNNNGGVEMQFFTPSSCSKSNLNNHSFVLVISYAQSKIIIPGDNEPPSWNELLEQDDFLSSIRGTGILVTPHHGRASGFSFELLQQINPYLAIISDGKFSDTTAMGRYSYRMQGWTVHTPRGQEERKCLTTRDDGAITVTFGEDPNRPFIEVRTAR